MAFYGKYNRRRNYRRGRRYLSNRNIFGKTSAKAQAKQIASLRNSVGKLAKLNRKEIRNVQETYKHTFNNSALSFVHDTMFLTTNFMEGQWTKLRGLSINGIIEYGDNYNAYPNNDITRSGSVRIIVYQQLQSRESTTAVQYLADISNTGTDYELNTTRPLKNGVTAFAKILVDKTYTLSNQQPQKRVNIYLRRLLSLHKEGDDSVPRGSIAIGIITSGLHWTSGGYSEQITTSLIAKQVYTED